MTQSPLQRAVELHSAGRLGEAETLYAELLARNPEHPEVLNMLGVLKAQRGETQTGAALIAKALEHKPKYAEAAFNLGRILHTEKNWQGAVLAYTRAVRLQPGHAKAWNNLAAAYEASGRREAALLTVAEGIKRDPKNELLFDNGCRFYKRDGDFEACLALAEAGLKHLPESARLWIHKAEACFALGRFDEAWTAYRWRFRTLENPNAAPTYPIPEWQGEDLTGKTILIWTEQGPGETFMFASCLPEIIDKAAKCIVVTTERLIPILARAFPDTQIENGDAFSVSADTADLQTSLIDTARWLRRSWSDFPGTPAYLACDETRRQEFRDKYTAMSNGKPIVGIAWRSRDVATAAEKSVTLDAWRAILSIPGVTFVSLQYGDTAGEIDAARQATNADIVVEDGLNPVADLDGHLAQVAAMDLVISTSNTTVHAAAAQGVPVWCLTPHTLGEGLRWQWFVGRDDSPWYPSLALYRQQTESDWSSPLARTALDLLKWVSARNPALESGSHATALAFAFHKAGQFENASLAAEYALAEGRQTISLYQIAAGGRRLAGETETALEILANADAQGISATGLRLERAACLSDQGAIDEAIAELTTAIEQAPDAAEAHNNLGRALRFRGRTEEALSAFVRAFELNPDLLGSVMSAGTCLYELGRTAECRARLEPLLSNADWVTDAASTLGMALLCAGQMEDGWSLYRHRIARPAWNVRYSNFAAPVWNGEDLAGKHVLAWTEQGIGEELIIATLLPDLIAACGKVTVLCSHRMVAVFKRSFPGIRIAEREDPLPAEAIDPAIDFQMSLSDIGQYLRPALDRFTPRSKAVLKAHPKRRKEVRARYRTGNEPLLGFSWHSGTQGIGPLKSMPVKQAVDFLQAWGVKTVSLQHAPSKDDLERFTGALGANWIADDAIDPLADMEDAVAQAAEMDGVVTISNTAAHIAGALNIPTALLVRKHTGRHWYWFRGQEVSAWYPSVRLFEVEREEDWQHQLEHAREFIASVVGRS